MEDFRTPLFRQPDSQTRNYTTAELVNVCHADAKSIILDSTSNRHTATENHPMDKQNKQIMSMGQTPTDKTTYATMRTLRVSS